MALRSSCENVSAALAQVVLVIQDGVLIALQLERAKPQIAQDLPLIAALPIRELELVESVLIVRLLRGDEVDAVLEVTPGILFVSQAGAGEALTATKTQAAASAARGERRDLGTQPT